MGRQIYTLGSPTPQVGLVVLLVSLVILVIKLEHHVIHRKFRKIKQPQVCFQLSQTLLNPQFIY